MSRLPIIFGTSGGELLDEEARFFEEVQPSGFILFARNCLNSEQLKKLTADLYAVVPDALIMIDQEGGRVMRMKPPEWPSMPAAKMYGEMYDRSPIMAGESLKKDTAQAAEVLTTHGFNVNCVPCCDLWVPNAHAVIGDRAFHEDPDVIAHLATIQARAYFDAGVQPVMKHIPGHGRASLDSHKDLPVIETDAETLQQDIAPFKALASAMGEDIWGMVCHCVYPNLDSSGLPAGCSEFMVQEIIRNQIGLTGKLVSDDIGMEAMAVIGDMGQRAKACLDAGADLVLHCSGKMDEMHQVMAQI